MNKEGRREARALLDRSSIGQKCRRPDPWSRSSLDDEAAYLSPDVSRDLRWRRNELHMAMGNNTWTSNGLKN